MENEFDLKYSDDALLSRVLYLASPTKLNIFVEDADKEYEYEEIFERLFPEELKIDIIFPTGGKIKLEEAFELFGKSNEYGNCFFIADGDFDIALKREQKNAPNFIYLSKYNIESYLLDKSVIINFMRPKLKKCKDEVEKKVEFETWGKEITPYLKAIFALHFIVQKNSKGIVNVAKGPSFFLNHNTGLPNENNFALYIKEIEQQIPDVKEQLPNVIKSLESIYGSEISCFVCGKYIIDSMARYLVTKMKKTKVGYDDLKSYLISNFDISSLEYVKKQLFDYIDSK